eukprot:2553787-Pyramimonas_sp.AAC.1
MQPSPGSTTRKFFPACSRLPIHLFSGRRLRGDGLARSRTRCAPKGLGIMVQGHVSQLADRPPSWAVGAAPVRVFAQRRQSTAFRTVFLSGGARLQALACTPARPCGSSVAFCCYGTALLRGRGPS